MSYYDCRITMGFHDRSKFIFRLQDIREYPQITLLDQKCIDPEYALRKLIIKLMLARLKFRLGWTQDTVLPFLVNSAALEEEPFLQKSYLNQHFKWPGQDTKAILKGWAQDLNNVNQTSYETALHNLEQIHEYH